MGVDLQTYRCRIAKGCAIMAKINAAREHDNHHICDIPFVVHSKPRSTPVWFCLAYVTVVVTLLLLMAGIEPNPGPDTMESEVHTSNPFSREIENGLRLSALLINVGTNALQKQLDRMVCDKHKNLSNALNSHKSKMENFNKGTQKTRKLLADNQFELLYPVNGKPELESFDITLLIFLFRNLVCLPPPLCNNWNDVPADSDTSFSADLVRIRMFRNIFYGHITTIGINSAQFNQRWDAIAEVLKRLNVKSKHIEDWKTKSISEQHQQDFRNKLKYMIVRDVEDMQTMANTTKCFLEKYENTLVQELSSVKDSVSGIKKEVSLFTSDMLVREQTLDSLLSVLSALPDQIAQTILTDAHNKDIEVQLKSILDNQDALLQNCEEIKRNITDQSSTLESIDKGVSGLKDVVKESEVELKSVSEKQDHLLENSAELKQTVTDQTNTMMALGESVSELCEAVKNGNKCIVENILKLKQETEGTCQHENSLIGTLKETLKEDSEVFKILIMNQPDNEYLTHKEELCYTLGCGLWNVVIDLNHYSRTPDGFFNKITQPHKKQKDFKVVTHKDASRVNEDDREMISKGERSLWILCNGCHDDNVDKPAMFGEVITEISPLLKSIFTKLLRQKRVVVLDLIMRNESKTERRSIKRVCEILAEVCESVADRIKYKESMIAHICTHNTFKDTIPSIDYDLQNPVYDLTCNQLISVLSDCFDLDVHSQKFYYPGDTENCYLTSEEMTKLNPYLILYHRDIGKIIFGDLATESEKQKIYDDIRFDFLKGNPLTPEALHINEKCQVYVVRMDMETLAEMVEKNLKEKSEGSKRTRRGHYTIYHDPSGGGTTTARYLLYTLRKKYPCAHVTKIDYDNLLVPLKQIYQDSRKPLLLVLDEQKYESDDAATLQRRLDNEHIKGLVVYVKRASEKCEESSAWASSFHYFISSKLDNEGDKLGFKHLYNAIKKKIESNKVFLFGLLAFCEEYARLYEHVTGCMENMTDDEKKIISVVYLVEKYGSVSTSMTLLSNLIPEGMRKRNDNLVNFLGYGSDLVIIISNKHEYCVKPVHRCVLETFMTWLAASEGNMGVILKMFIERLFFMFSRNDSSKVDSMALWKDLFIKRDDSHFTTLLQDLETHSDENPENINGKEYVAETLWNFTKLYESINKEQHPRALYARYLFYHVKDEKQGIEQIIKAVGLLVGTSVVATNVPNDPTLITIYGSMFKSKAYGTFQSYLEKGDVDAGITAAIEDYEEAVHAFSLAQRFILDNKRSSTMAISSVQAFLGEVKARSNFLGLCFDHKCKNDHEYFQKYLTETTHSFLKDSEKRVQEILDQLDIAIRMDKVHDNNPSKTGEEILELKFKLLRMRYDGNTTIKKLLANLPDDVPCDIGSLVRLNARFLRQTRNPEFRKCCWDDVRLEDLESIIKKIDKRIHTKHMSSANYMALIKAMQILRQRSKANRYKKYNLDYALEAARQWHLKYPNEPSSFFNYGCLKFVKGLETKKERLLINEGIDLIKHCSEMYKSNPSAKYMNTIIFAVGVGEGLEKLISYKAVQGKGQLYTFYGRQQSHTISVKLTPHSRPIENLRAIMFLDQDFKQSDANQQPLLQFNLALRLKNPFVAFNVERVQETP